jgi:hypothetical protein
MEATDRIGLQADLGRQGSDMKDVAEKKVEHIGPEGIQFLCGVCGKVAATVTLVCAGRPDPRLTPEPEGAPLGVSRLGIENARLSIDGGPVSCTMMVADADITAVKDALLAGDASVLYAINYEFAPFWCPSCKCSYCHEHYVSVPTFDDGFYDAMYACCPKGHRRKIDD